MGEAEAAAARSAAEAADLGAQLAAAKAEAASAAEALKAEKEGAQLLQGRIQELMLKVEEKDGQASAASDSLQSVREELAASKTSIDQLESKV